MTREPELEVHVSLERVLFSIPTTERVAHPRQDVAARIRYRPRRPRARWRSVLVLPDDRSTLDEICEHAAEIAAAHYNGRAGQASTPL